MKLLLATDHRFLQRRGEVFDTYCFGTSFFDDYLTVFDSVVVCSRLIDTSSLPAGAFRSDGHGVSFLPIPDITGLRWILRAKSVCHQLLSKAVNDADAIVARLPSQLGYWAAQMAIHKAKPYMVEVIGDPEEAILHAGKGCHYRLLAWREMNRLQALAQDASVASYVSKYLQSKYPVKEGSPSDTISSIRLYEREISSPRRHEPKTQPFRVVFVASLLPYKRQADLINAAAICRSEGIPLQLHFAGGGPLLSQLESLVQELDLEEHVVFYGHIADRQQLEFMLDTSELFVITSASEGLPRSVLEAMSRGLPVIGSRAGGIPELVRETELFEVGDVQHLARMICCLYKDPKYLDRLSSYSIETARKYSMSMLMPKRQDLYQKLAEMAAHARRTPRYAKSSG